MDEQLALRPSSSVRRPTRRALAAAQRHVAAVDAETWHDILLDHGTLEALAGDGHVAISALVLAGADWSVEVDGDVSITTIG